MAEAFLQKLWHNVFWNPENRASLEDPSIPLSSKNIDKFFNIGAMNESGVNVTEETALTFAAVYRAIVLRGDTIGALPVHVFENQSDGKKKIVRDHNVSFLLSREPNERQTAFTYKQTAQGHHDLFGNAYSIIESDQRGQITSLDQLNPETVTPILKDKKLFYEVRESLDGSLNTKVYPANQIIHIPNYGFTGLVGRGIIDMARESMGGALAQQKFGSRFFKNNAQPSGILSSQNATDTQSIQAKEAWQKSNSGTNEAGTAVMRGDWKYETITIPPEQAQFLQSREFSVVEVARWFGIEPHLLFDLRRASHNSIEQQSIEFAVYTIMGLVRRWEQELDRKLFTEAERRSNKFYTKFNINALLRADIKSRGEWYRMLVQNGIMKINEVRELEDMNATKDGDVAFIQKNMQPLSTAEKQAEKDLTK
jgi:HK97 family phage portal protein